MMAQKSHIQITRALLKNFSHKSFINGKPEGRKAFYLDLKDNQIKEEKINILGTEEGYYSAEMENYLSKNVESKFGVIMRNAFDYTNGKIERFTIDSVIIKTFFLYSILRSNYIFNKVNNDRSALAKLLLPPISHEEILLHPEAAEGAFSDYFANIFFNDSTTDLVIPKNCVYQVAYKSGNACAFLPITPKIAFILMQNNDNDEMFHGDSMLAANTSEESLINIFNEKALEYEQNWSNKFIVASRTIELEYLKNVIANKEISRI